MKDTLKVGLTHEFRFTVPESKIVPALLPESPEFQLMPRVSGNRIYGRIDRVDLHTGCQSASWIGLESRLSASLLM